MSFVSVPSQLCAQFFTTIPTTIAILGTFDSKGAEHAFIAAAVRRAGFAPLLIDVGSLDAPSITPDVTRAEAFTALDSPDTAALAANASH